MKVIDARGLSCPEPVVLGIAGGVLPGGVVVHQDLIGGLAALHSRPQQHHGLGAGKRRRMDADLYQMTYFATFFSHFGAMRYQQLCREQGIECRVMPVPRNLSSSCGTCVRCEGRWLEPQGEAAGDVERIAAWDGRSYTPVYQRTEE